MIVQRALAVLAATSACGSPVDAPHATPSRDAAAPRTLDAAPDAATLADAKPVEVKRLASACPVFGGREPWSPLVFPACAAYPYMVAFGLPDDHPCKVTDASAKLVLVYAYDDRGRWLSSTVDGLVSRRCRYDGDRLAGCETINTQGDGFGQVFRADATYEHDRLVKIGDVGLHYNDAGDVDTITSHGVVTQLDYDASHRVVGERHDGDLVRYTYDDAANHVVTRGDERFAYAGGKLVKVSTGDRADLITYDKRGRVATIQSSSGLHRTFTYCQ